MPTIDMRGSWMLLKPGASSDMLKHQGLLQFGFFAHPRGAISRTTVPRDNCMLNIHGDQFTASYVRATLVLLDGYVSVKSLGTPAPLHKADGFA